MRSNWRCWTRGLPLLKEPTKGSKGIVPHIPAWPFGNCLSSFFCLSLSLSLFLSLSFFFSLFLSLSFFFFLFSLSLSLSLFFSIFTSFFATNCNIKCSGSSNKTKNCGRELGRLFYLNNSIFNRTKQSHSNANLFTL